MDYGSNIEYIVQQAIAALSVEGVRMEIFHEAVLNGDAEQMNRVIDMEMERLRQFHLRKEEEYAEQKLLENPIITERRIYTKQREQPSNEDEIDVVTVIETEKKASDILKKQHHAEICHRSRHNNKIRVAKLKYRTEFRKLKLLQTTTFYKWIQSDLAQVENYALMKGVPRDKIEQLRKCCGIKEENGVAAAAQK